MSKLSIKDFKYFMEELAIWPENDLREIAMEDYDYEAYTTSYLEILLTAKSGPMYADIAVFVRCLHIVDSRDEPPSHEVEVDEILIEKIMFHDDNTDESIDLTTNKLARKLITKELEQ